MVYLRHVFVKGNAGRVLPKLPDTFDRTLTASPVPLRVGLRCGMGAPVINNIGRRSEAKEHCKSFSCGSDATEENFEN